MQVITGDAVSTDDHILKAITIEGETIGWLGLKKRQKVSRPVEKAFLREQSKAFIVIGVIVLALAALVSFDVRRYAAVITYVAAASIGFGLAILVIDIQLRLPLWWVLGEGPLVVAVGAAILILQAAVKRSARTDEHPPHRGERAP